MALRILIHSTKARKFAKSQILYTKIPFSLCYLREREIKSYETKRKHGEIISSKAVMVRH
jgi:hypothetical protein